jgi:hypothetical protein
MRQDLSSLNYRFMARASLRYDEMYSYNVHLKATDSAKNLAIKQVADRRTSIPLILLQDDLQNTRPQTHYRETSRDGGVAALNPLLHILAGDQVYQRFCTEATGRQTAMQADKRPCRV